MRRRKSIPDRSWFAGPIAAITSRSILTFQTTPDLRIPAYVLLPKQTRPAAPGILVLHSHDGIYLWGKEKVVAVEPEHPYLTTFKQERYGGRASPRSWRAAVT